VFVLQLWALAAVRRWLENTFALIIFASVCLLAVLRNTYGAPLLMTHTKTINESNDHKQ